MASGGRVLAVTAIDENRKWPQTAYQGVAAIDWAEGFYCTDIAAALGLDDKPAVKIADNASERLSCRPPIISGR